MSFETRRVEISQQIDACLNREIAALPPSRVRHAMMHTTQGGKRLRGFLVMESARLHGIAAERAIWPAAAIEALHAYSLVHDDLPCMDNDDLRRGLPTIHVKWDEATAILAGDALQSLAFALVLHHEVGAHRAELAQTLAQAAGGAGMVYGQALDVAAETATAPLSLSEITALQAGKTGALIEWSACAGAVMANCDPDALRRYARALGLAFQIADDILDVEGDAEQAGKRLHKDAEAGKATFVSHLGLEGARTRARSLVEEAETALSAYGGQADALRAAARFVISRTY